MTSTRYDCMVRRSLPLGVVLALTLIGSSAPAQKSGEAGVLLDAAAAKPLLSDRDWTTTVASGTVRYWTWNSDGSVCLRLMEKEAKKCDDTGRWKFDRNHVCYELSWWGESVGLKSKCFRILDRGEGRYVALENSDVPFFEFRVSR